MGSTQMHFFFIISVRNRTCVGKAHSRSPYAAPAGNCRFIRQAAQNIAAADPQFTLRDRVTTFHLAPSSQATMWCYKCVDLDNVPLPPFPGRGVKKKVITLFTIILQESICQQLRYHLQHKYPNPIEIRPCCLIP